MKKRLQRPDEFVRLSCDPDLFREMFAGCFSRRFQVGGAVCLRLRGSTPCRAPEVGAQAVPVGTAFTGTFGSCP